MLEDSRMDKKLINRSSQSQSRASAIDCKKGLDSAHKPLTRYNKKRDGTGSAPKNEPYRKNAPTQRGRGNIDRRPRGRESSGFNVGGTEITGIAEDDAELGSVFVPGSKKQNLNHLLNFMYTPRGVPDRRGGIPRRNVSQRCSTVHPHNNDLYLQACCQFVVRDDGDYKANLLDPDVPVKWEQIVEVVVRSTGKSECPICLGAPVTGRVGRCGHVFCWPCALRYAATHDRQPPPCPVCMFPLRVDQMKPAQILLWESPAEEITMRLVRRLRGSTMVEVAPPRGQLTADSPSEILPLENIQNSPYSKIFAANKKQVRDVLEREMKELEIGIYEAIDEAEVTFMNQAKDSLRKEEANLSTMASLTENAQIVDAKVEDTAPTVYEKQTTCDKKIDWFDEDEGAACMENLKDQTDIENIQEQIHELNLNTEQSNLNPDAVEFMQPDYNDNQAEEFPYLEHETSTKEDKVPFDLTDVDKENQAKYFYFYQAEDGQHVFLNSLNVRILNASWGTLAAAPSIIKGRVLHRETFSLIEQTRKHMPYTAHLPLYCPFDIVELELQPPYVSESALYSYADDLDRRARTRARLEREERRRERAYRRATEGPPKPDFSSPLLFPPTSPPQYSSPPMQEDVSSPVDASPPCNVTASPSGLSFAKMASTSGTWRVRPTRPIRPPTPPPNDEEASAPRALSLSDAIEAALHAAPKASSKKSKKGKQKLLFTTGMQRAE